MDKLSFKNYFLSEVSKDEVLRAAKDLEDAANDPSSMGKSRVLLASLKDPRFNKYLGQAKDASAYKDFVVKNFYGKNGMLQPTGQPSPKQMQDAMQLYAKWQKGQNTTPEDAIELLQNQDMADRVARAAGGSGPLAIAIQILSRNFKTQEVQTYVNKLKTFLAKNQQQPTQSQGQTNQNIPADTPGTQQQGNPTANPGKQQQGKPPATTGTPQQRKPVPPPPRKPYQGPMAGAK
jgi:hypothetical protein